MQGERDLDRSVVVATLPSASVALSSLIEASDLPISTMLIDEAHHAVAGSAYERILTLLEASFGETPVVTVGFTATPYRSDEKSMFSLLPTCAFAREIPDMIGEKPPIHQWIEFHNLPLRQQVALVHEATGGIFQKALGSKEASWLEQPASEQQLAALHRLHKGLAKEAREQGWTKGAVSQAISYLMLSKTLKHPPSTPDAS